MILDEHINQWQNLLEEMRANEAFSTFNYERDKRRVHVQQEMCNFLNSYLGGEIDNDVFRNIFHNKTVNEWDVFGFKGFSGGMFLNMLVNNVPDQQNLAQQLKNTLPAPNDQQESFDRLTNFTNYLNSLVIHHQIPKRKLQPAHAPFFFSGWWHMQIRDEWPVYYVSARRTLSIEGIFQQTNDPIEDYFIFRELFLELAQRLSLDVWEMEHLCRWYEERNNYLAPSANIPEITVTDHYSTTVKAPDDEEETKSSVHTQVQYTLARIGLELGCKVWIASNDQNKFWGNERLGDLSVKSLPQLGLDPRSQKIIARIDVLWLRGIYQVAAAFEIEHSTSIYSGLLRMSDLTIASPNINFPLYIVTSETRMNAVRGELSRLTFQSIELHKRCGFFSYELLMAEAENIIRWANDPKAIDRLAQWVGDVTEFDTD